MKQAHIGRGVKGAGSCSSGQRSYATQQLGAQVWKKNFERKERLAAYGHVACRDALQPC